MGSHRRKFSASDKPKSWVTLGGFCLGEFLLVNLIFKLAHKAAGFLMAYLSILRATETFETRCHAAKSGLKLTILMKMTLYFLFSCLHLPSAEIFSMCHAIQFMCCWEYARCTKGSRYVSQYPTNWATPLTSR